MSSSTTSSRLVAPALPPALPASVTDEFWRRLLHRWLVQYNPAYIASAALVLCGLNLVSKGWAARGNLYNELGLAAIAELYAATLIGAAAVLVRRGSWRPAVMLGLLAVLYQGDLTLQTETNVYLGTVGGVASAAWVGIFGAKLAALAWALRLRLSRSAWALLMVGALGISVLPRLSQVMPERPLSALVAAWWFTLMSIGLHSRRQVLSLASLNDWGNTVLQRSVRVSWVTLSVLLSAHVLFWCARFDISAAPLLPAAALLSLRWIRRERAVWLSVGLTLLITGWLLPHALSAAAVAVTIALAIRAYRQPTTRKESEPPAPIRSPYRAPQPEGQTVRQAYDALIPAPHRTQRSYLLASLASLHLAAWCAHWTGGSWPEHTWWLDAALLAVALLCSWRLETRALLWPPALVYCHLLALMIPKPQSMVDWGATCLLAGFGLLIGSLAAHLRLQRWIYPEGEGQRVAKRQYAESQACADP